MLFVMQVVGNGVTWGNKKKNKKIFYSKRIFKLKKFFTNFAKFQENTQVPDFFLKQFTELQLAPLLKKRLQHRFLRILQSF